MKRITPFILTAVLAFSLSACSEHENMEHGTSAEINGLIIQDVVVRPPLPGRNTATGYFTLVNNGEATRLISASSPVSEQVEIHTHTNENGVMKMRRVEHVDVVKGGRIEFKPGSYHLMMFNVNSQGDFSNVPLTLTFDNGRAVRVNASAGEAKPDSHSEHGNH